MTTTDTSRRTRLSWLWVFVMLNMIFADILSFMYPGFLEQIMNGHAEGITITPEFLLLAAVVTEIPIAMVVLTQVLPQRAARWANLVAGVVTIVYVIGMGAAAPHYYFIGGLETLACIVIVWSAWTWRTADERLAAPARPMTPEQAQLQQL
jgi:hypothetical protein